MKKTLFLLLLFLTGFLFGCSSDEDLNEDIHDTEQETSTLPESESASGLDEEITSRIPFEERETCHTSDFPPCIEPKCVEDTDLWGNVEEIKDDTITFELLKAVKVENDENEGYHYVYVKIGKNTFYIADDIRIFVQLYVAEAYIEISIDELEYYLEEYGNPYLVIDLDEQGKIIGLHEMYLG